MPLTQVQLKNLKPGQRSVKAFDGGGLYIEVTPTGSKLWRWKYRFRGTERRLALGAWPEVTLAEARDAREDARRMLRAGIDPSEQRRATKAGTPTEATFETIAERWLAEHCAARTQKTRDTNRDRLTRFAFPVIGAMHVNEVKPADVLRVLNAIRARGTLETAHRVQQVISQVLRFAVANGLAERDVTSDLRGALPPAPVQHMAAITEPDKVRPLLRAIWGYDGGAVVRCALQLAPLVFVRPGELRHAEWREIDLAAGEWAIPAEKMKMKSAHLVPLSRQAIAVLKEIRTITGGGRYVFPSMRSASRPMSNAAINAALRRIGFAKTEMTGHGFRAMARTILDERLRFPAHLIEHQLAHAVRDPLGYAYNRTTHIDERRHMMQTWADYLDELRNGNIVAFPKVEKMANVAAG